MTLNGARDYPAALAARPLPKGRRFSYFVTHRAIYIHRGAAELPRPASIRQLQLESDARSRDFRSVYFSRPVVGFGFFFGLFLPRCVYTPDDIQERYIASCSDIRFALLSFAQRQIFKFAKGSIVFQPKDLI